MPVECSLRAERGTAGKPGPTGATTPLRMWHLKGPNMSCISSSFVKSPFRGTVQHFSPLGVVLLLVRDPPPPKPSTRAPRVGGNPLPRAAALHPRPAAPDKADLGQHAPEHT